MGAPLVDAREDAPQVSEEGCFVQRGELVCVHPRAP